MLESKSFLDEIRIRNFRSLRSVALPLKPLTILVGPNASGKSNVLNALALLNSTTSSEELPPSSYVQKQLWAGEAGDLSFEAFFTIEETPTTYKLVLKPDSEAPFDSEHLLVNDVEVISIRNGEGIVRDEDGENETTYRSKKLALYSAGDYGEKPVTGALTEFIRGWEFYDFQPDMMRGPVSRFRRFIMDETIESDESPQLNKTGSILNGLLSYWHANERERFNYVSEALSDSTSLRIGFESVDGEKELCLLEGYDNPIPLQGASEGTLRLVAYYTLLNERVVNPLIAIEEPERNLHPRALKDIADVLQRIAEQSQVIITTHSSQLLDAFPTSSLSESLGILLLRSRPGHGTEVFNLDEIRRDRASLDGWVEDFGIGSGIFESELLQDLMEKPRC